MSDKPRPKVSEIGAARAIAVMNLRLGDPTPDWIMKVASTRLPSDPADQAAWTPLVSR